MGKLWSKIMTQLESKTIVKLNECKISEEMHRVDIVLPDDRSFFLMLHPNLKGRDLVNYCDSLGVQDYVLCRDASNSPTYEVLYSKDTNVVPIEEPFKKFCEESLSAYFVPDRTITSKFQRMCVFIFTLEKFVQDNKNYCSPTKLNLARKKITIRVTLPTGLDIELDIKRNQTIVSINKKLHEQLIEIYGEESVRGWKSYRLATLNGFIPSRDGRFDAIPEVMNAYRRQRLEPHRAHFVYKRIWKETEFDQQAKQFIHDLAILPVTQNDETRRLNTNLSKIRIEAEAERHRAWQKNELAPRMRLSEVEPPLTTMTKQNIQIKAQLSIDVGKETSPVTILCGFDDTADQAITALFSKLKSEFGLDESLDAQQFVLMIKGTDEIIGGPILLLHFMYVRQFLISDEAVMECALVERKPIVDRIKAKDEPPMPEPSEDDQYKEFVVKTAPTPNFSMMAGYPHTTNAVHLSVMIGSCFKIPGNGSRYYVRVQLIHGMIELCPPVETCPAAGSSSVTWNQLVELKASVCSIPREARISITLYNCDDPAPEKAVAVATYNYAVFNQDGWLNSGTVDRRMWNGKGPDPILTTCESQENDAVYVRFGIPRYKFPIYFERLEECRERMRSSMRVTQAMRERLAVIENMNPLEELIDSDKDLLWSQRYEVCGTTNMVCRVLASVDYTIPAKVQEIPMILRQCEVRDPAEVLTLLDADFPDTHVRTWAVEQLNRMSDDDIMLYMLQLVQALKYELYDDSPLVRFLFRRGLMEPRFVGHKLFWQLISEAHLSHIRMRFSSIVVNFLYGIGFYREELLKGYMFTQQLTALNQLLTIGEDNNNKEGDPSERLRSVLRDIEIPDEFHLPVDPRIIVKSFILDKCKVMDSKKKPFWLAFENAFPAQDGQQKPVYTMFKVGDDLRQDQLTLQVLKSMEHIWRRNGYDLKMSCYGVLPTGKEQGFIEVVPNSVTEASLLKKKLTGATTFVNYLKKCNPEDSAFKSACEVFRLSSASYAVATCVLGIGDRHPGNIMVQEDGHFFHIDFGHFLGNFKTKYGVKRETAPFHFGKTFQSVIDIAEKELTPGTPSFQAICGEIFNILRHNSQLLITLFLLMLGSNIPELRSKKDIQFLNDMLVLHMDDQQAAEHFAYLTKKSFESVMTGINNVIHVVVH